MTGQPWGGALFDDTGLRVEPDPIEALSVDRRRTIRQAGQIRAGIHPLLATLRAADARLHPQAHREASREDRRGLPFTCGSCLHLVQQGGTSGRYLKCDYGEDERITHGPATDVRAWWPACLDYLGPVS